MRVLMLVHGSGGDVYPQIAVGRALARRGHEVSFVTNPYFAGAVRSAGLDFIASGTEAEGRAAIDNPELWQRGKGIRVLFDGVLRAMPETYEIVRNWRRGSGGEVVTANILSIGARVAHDKLGIPLVTLHLQPIVIRSLYEQPGLVTPEAWRPVVKPLRALLTAALDRWVFDPAITPRLNDFRATLNLPPVRRIFKDWIHSPQRVVCLFPGWFGRQQPDWPPQTRLTGFPLFDQVGDEGMSPELESFLDDGPAPVVFTAGTAQLFAKHFFAVSAETCRRSGRRAVLLTRFAEQIPRTLPASVMHAPYAPFSLLLPKAAALVHHGGIGTASQALASGIPQLVVPSNFDQPDNAARLRRLGVAESIREKAYREDAVEAALARLLGSPAVRAACADMAHRIAEAGDPLPAVCHWIEETAALTPAAGGSVPRPGS